MARKSGPTTSAPGNEDRYYHFKPSPLYYVKDKNESYRHPCVRCGLERQSKEPWTACDECISVDPEMLGHTISGKPRQTKWYDGDTENDEPHHLRTDNLADAS